MGSNARRRLIASHGTRAKSSARRRPSSSEDIWALRVRLQMESRVRELALFNLGIDSKLRGCDLVSLKVRDICHGDQVASRAGGHAAQDAAPGSVPAHARDPRRQSRSGSSKPA